MVSRRCGRRHDHTGRQRVLSILVHPESPIERLLVAWTLGSGKTIGMIRLLDSRFDDVRPKVILFPTEAIAENFYRELATMPSRYRPDPTTAVGRAVAIGCCPRTA